MDGRAIEIKQHDRHRTKERSIVTIPSLMTVLTILMEHVVQTTAWSMLRKIGSSTCR